MLKLAPIYNNWVTPGGSSEYMSLYCGCINVIPAKEYFGMQEEGEDTYINAFKTNVAFKFLAKKQIKNAHTIIALQWLQTNLKK